MTSNVMGRPKGVTGEKSRMVSLIMQRYDYDPIEAMVKLVKDGDDELGLPIDLDMKIALHKELAQYRYPKRKAIEIEPGAGPLNLVVYSGIEGPPGSDAPEPDDLGLD